MNAALSFGAINTQPETIPTMIEAPIHQSILAAYFIGAVR